MVTARRNSHQNNHFLKLPSTRLTTRAPSLFGITIAMKVRKTISAIRVISVQKKWYSKILNSIHWMTLEQNSTTITPPSTLPWTQGIKMIMSGQKMFSLMRMAQLLKSQGKDTFKTKKMISLKSLFSRKRRRKMSQIQSINFLPSIQLRQSCK